MSSYTLYKGSKLKQCDNEREWEKRLNVCRELRSCMHHSVRIGQGPDPPHPPSHTHRHTKISALNNCIFVRKSTSLGHKTDSTPT